MTKNDDRIRNLYDALAESVVEASENEVLDECRESGETPDKVAAHMRQILQRAWNDHQQRPARETYLRAASLAHKVRADLPDTAEERRTLFMRVLSQHSEVVGTLLENVRDIEKVTDRDVQRCLEQLDDLGLLPPRKDSQE